MTVDWVTEEQPRRRRLVIVAAAAAGVLLLVAAVILGSRLLPAQPSAAPTGQAVTSAGSAGSSVEPVPPPAASSPAPTVDPGAAQAAVIDRMLDRSGAVRGGVQPALNRTFSCRATAADRSALRRAEVVREDLVRELADAEVEAIPDGRQLAARLSRLWSGSARADHYYLAWSRSKTGCAGKAATDANYDKGTSISTDLNGKKDAWAEDWNAVAGEYGLVRRSDLDI